MTNWSLATPLDVVWRRIVVVFAAFAGVLVVSLSARVASWWGAVGHGGTWAPGPLEFLLVHRPDIGEADVNALMWLTIAGLAAWTMRSPRMRMVALFAAWILGAAVELVQAEFTTRSAEWSDVAGNSLGVGVAAMIVLVVTWRSSVATRVHGVRRPPLR